MLRRCPPLFAALFLFIPTPAHADLTPLDISGYINSNLQLAPGGQFLPNIPAGGETFDVTSGGLTIPFQLEPYVGFGPAPTGLGVIQTQPGTPTIPSEFPIGGIDVKNVGTVYVLLNSLDGISPDNVGALQFLFSNGTTQTTFLNEGTNIRNFNTAAGGYNIVNPASIGTIPFNNGQQILDVVPFGFSNLPRDVALDEIKFLGYGDQFPHSGLPFIAGITLQTIPEPSSAILAGSGILLVAFAYRRAGKCQEH